ncbi:hypothetical protein M2R47_02285 [Moraxella sp. Tifton1]|uniref:Lipoprotein n=1 Tax=Moraxella oculi TaxID=2940516 RepID=A0ABW8U475_9GAMM|nr:hypothetical protein [Moraxella sp. Tifton1]MCL1623082.1 hypothetical protein [Moraxella sp. Tifton1]
MKIIAPIVIAAIALTGCNAMTKASDKIFYKQSNFSLSQSTEYPAGEGLEYDAQVKADAALVDMKKTQAEGAQRPSNTSITKHDELNKAQK